MRSPRRAPTAAGCCRERASTSSRRGSRRRRTVDRVRTALPPTRWHIPSRRRERASSGSRATFGPKASTPMHPRQKSSTTTRGARKIAPRRGERRDREREHRDGVDEAERDDGEGDRLQAERHTAEAAERRDLDDVVEPERKDDAACGRGSAGCEASAAIGSRRCGEQLPPTERPEDEAREVGGTGGERELDLRALERPARAGETTCDEHGDDQADRAHDSRHDRWRTWTTSAEVLEAAWSCLRDHEEGDRRVLTGQRDEHQGMEDLVIAEQAGKGSGRRRAYTTAPAVYATPPATSSAVASTPIRSTIWRTTITDTEPSATPSQRRPRAARPAAAALPPWRRRRRPRRPPGSGAASHRGARAGRTACTSPRSARRSSRGRGAGSIAFAPESNHGDERGSLTPSISTTLAANTSAPS